MHSKCTSQLGRNCLGRTSFGQTWFWLGLAKLGHSPQTQRHTQRHTHGDTHMDTHTWTHTHGHTHMDTHTWTHTDTQTDRETHRRTERQTDGLESTRVKKDKRNNRLTKCSHATSEVWEKKHSVGLGGQERDHERRFCISTSIRL